MDTKLFDDWNIQLAKTYKPGMIKPDTLIAITQKINGVRATYFASNLISRTGHQILGFDEIKRELKILNKHLDSERYVFDGELRLADQYCEGLTDNDAFKYSVGIANSQKDFSRKHMLKFIIFDVIVQKDFTFEQPTESYIKRFAKLKEVERIIQSECLTHLSIVPVLYIGTDISMIEQYSTAAYMAGYEGIMINLDSSYQYKRTSQLLKYKKFNTIDLKVVGFAEGTGKYEGTLGALICAYKNNQVFVGSGFTDKQRNDIWDNLEHYLNKIVEVKYKDITSDANTGLESLQFPVFIGFRTDKNISDA